MPLTMPLPRYFSMPSLVVGAVLASISARKDQTTVEITVSHARRRTSPARTDRITTQEGAATHAHRRTADTLAPRTQESFRTVIRRPQPQRRKYAASFVHGVERARGLAKRKESAAQQ